MTETAERFVLTIPTATRFQGVATLVLGGIGSRLELPFERMDDLQLAVLSLLAAGSGENIELEVETDGQEMSVAVGPLAVGSASDEGLTRVLERLADSVEPLQRDEREWLRLRLVFPRSSA